MTMSMPNASISSKLYPIAAPPPLLLLLSRTPFPISCPPASFSIPNGTKLSSLHTSGRTGISLIHASPCRAVRANHIVDVRTAADDEEEEGFAVDEAEEPIETLVYSISPMPLLLLATLPGAGVIRSLYEPFVELVKSWSLPDWLVHWGHPGNMAVVLLAMGGYGTYLGFRIRSSDDMEEKAKAKDLHPKLMAGMFFFFALGATGGIISLLTSDRPILESPHAVTGIIGLALLTIQTITPTLFEGNPGLRNVHGIIGSSTMTLFLVHAALGLQLGLSY